MATHHIQGEEINEVSPLAVIAVSGGSGNNSHILFGETIDEDHPLAVHDAGATPGVTDHGALSGLADNDHPQYLRPLANGVRIASGVQTITAASHTIATGLATVVAVVASYQTDLTLEQIWCSASPGNQAGAPAAGSFILKTYRGTESPATSDQALPPAPSTNFAGTPKVAWIAIGT